MFGTLKYLAELKADLASFRDIGTDVTVSSVVPHWQLRACTNLQQRTREYAEASEERLLLAKLPVAEGASFDSRH